MSEPFIPSAEQIQIIQNHEKGWEDLWEQICAELLGNGSNSCRLFRAVKGYLSRFTAESKNVENLYEDFASYILTVFQERVEKRLLFAEYNADEFDDVYAWLLNSTNLRFCYSSFSREELGYKSVVCTDKETGEKKRKFVKKYSISETSNSDKREDNNFLDNLPYISQELEDSFLVPEGFNLSRIVLKIAPETKTFDRIESQAGLQLYPRLDNSDATMIRLTQSVCEQVRSANALYSDPNKTIRDEHELAVERIEQRIEKYDNKLYDAIKKRRRVHKPEIQKNILRKKHEADIELHVCPLDADSLMRLLSIKRDNADKRRSRYFFVWKTLFFSKEFIQEMETDDE